MGDYSIGDHAVHRIL